jgi:glycine/D-amino acid oxidase-like deaminating enzyme
MTLQERSVWLNDVALPQGEAGAVPPRVDVAVVGAGITGLTAARALVRRGARVAVLEARDLGWGASSRNGGMVLTGLKLGFGELVAKYGVAKARQLFCASLAAIDCVEAIVREEQIACDFARTGHLLLAYKPSHIQAGQQEAALLQRELGYETRILGREELKGEIDTPRYHGGMIDPVSAGVHPARYVAGLAQAARRAGACLYDHTPVERIAREGSTFWLGTPRGMLRADDVLLATGGYTAQLPRPLKRRIFPLGSFIIATAPLPEARARALLPHNRMVFDSKHLLYYFRLTPDRRLLFGGRAAFFPESATTVRQSAAILRRDMLSVFPQLHDVPSEYVWGGVLDVAFDLMPHAGQADGMHYALGYAGHGVAMATYLGTRVADAMLDGAPGHAFAGLPFPGAPLGLYNGRPWFLPLAATWYKLLDAIQ